MITGSLKRNKVGKHRFEKKRVQGVPWWSSGLDSVFSLPQPRANPQLEELRSLKPSSQIRESIKINHKLYHHPEKIHFYILFQDFSKQIKFYILHINEIILYMQIHSTNNQHLVRSTTIFNFLKKVLLQVYLYVLN